MNTGRLKDMLADVDDDFPVLVKTSDGWKGVSLAYEEILWDEKTIPGDELEAFCIELAPPVEELEPYSVEKNIHGWIVYKDNPGNVVANFNNTHPHAKVAAEAECARLNAEYRKEQE